MNQRVYDKESFDNWDLALNTLEAWGVLLPEVVSLYKNLAAIRNQKAIHFNPETDMNDRSYALEAIHILRDIIQRQFSGFGTQPWFIPKIPGCSFIKKEAEALPFIREVYVPNCVLVGPYHKVDSVFDGVNYRLVVKDDYPYEDCEITDEEFAQLYRNQKK
jgi:hypothetical protein